MEGWKSTVGERVSLVSGVILKSTAFETSYRSVSIDNMIVRFSLLERGTDNNYYNLLEEHLEDVKTQVCRKFSGGNVSSNAMKIFSP